MSKNGQKLFVVVVILLSVCYALYARGRNESERRERLDLCFQDDPRSAAKFYSAKTHHEDKVAIVEGCLGPEPPEQ